MHTELTRYRKPYKLMAMYTRLCAEATGHIQIIGSEKEWGAYLMRLGGRCGNTECAAPTRYPVLVTTQMGMPPSHSHTFYYEDGTYELVYT